MQRTIIANPKAALTQARQLLASDPAAAEAQARNLLAANPDDPAALRVLGGALRRLGKLADARAAEHSALEASTRNPGHRAAAQALQSGDAARAHALLRALLAEDDSDVLALTMLGLQAANFREFEIAAPLLKRAVAEAPDEPASRMALAEFFILSKQPALALAQIDNIDPAIAQSEPIQSLRAEALSGLGRLEDELGILERLAAADAPNVIRYGLRIGHALHSLGRDQEAIAVHRSIISQHPAEGTSWWSLANLKTFSFDDADLATMEAGLATPGMPVQNAIRLNFALGKAYEDRRKVKQSFAHYAEGNRLRTTISNYDPLMIGAWVDRNIALFTAPFFAARAGQGALARDPIFIIGMQRSGSTLVEQILASHPAVEGTAELNDIPNLVRDIGEAATNANRRFEDYLPSLNADQLRHLGETYLDTSRISRTTDRALFTDKMPNNWMQLGLIHTILPNARIIDVRRDPLSCCFSNWKQLYARGLDHSNTLETMAQYYIDYVRMMRHFDLVTPGLVHRIIYDDLVDGLEGEVRRLLDYLDLPFDPACLAFHSNERAVRTISAGQVRKPINRDGIGQWQMFEQWLDPLKAALGDTLEDWRR